MLQMPSSPVPPSPRPPSRLRDRGPMHSMTVAQDPPHATTSAHAAQDAFFGLRSQSSHLRLWLPGWRVPPPSSHGVRVSGLLRFFGRRSHPSHLRPTFVPCPRRTLMLPWSHHSRRTTSGHLRRRRRRGRGGAAAAVAGTIVEEMPQEERHQGLVAGGGEARLTEARLVAAGGEATECTAAAVAPSILSPAVAAAVAGTAAAVAGTIAECPLSDAVAGAHHACVSLGPSSASRSTCGSAPLDAAVATSVAGSSLRDSSTCGSCGSSGPARSCGSCGSGSVACASLGGDAQARRRSAHVEIQARRRWVTQGEGKACGRKALRVR